MFINDRIFTRDGTYNYSSFECKESKEFLFDCLKPFIHGEAVHPLPSTEQIFHCIVVHITATFPKFFLFENFQNI